MSEPIIRTLRKSDYPALIDVVRRMWYPEYDEKTGLLAAETDWENCLARATCAFTAELDGEPVALILGRVDALDHRRPLNTHRINSLRGLLRPRMATANRPRLSTSMRGWFPRIKLPCSA